MNQVTCCWFSFQYTHMMWRCQSSIIHPSVGSLLHQGRSRPTSRNTLRDPNPITIQKGQHLTGAHSGTVRYSRVFRGRALLFWMPATSCLSKKRGVVSLWLRGFKNRMQERSLHTHRGMCLPDPPFSFAISQESLQANDGAGPAYSKVTLVGGALAVGGAAAPARRN